VASARQIGRFAQAQPLARPPAIHSKSQLARNHLFSKGRYALAQLAMAIRIAYIE
jgi:hypothetical protein